MMFKKEYKEYFNSYYVSNLLLILVYPLYSLTQELWIINDNNY